MKTLRFRTHHEAVIVETPTRITLLSTSAAADLGAIGRYCVLPSFIHIEFHPSIVLCHSNNPPFAAQQPLKRMGLGRSVSRYVSHQHSGERIVHGLE